MMMFRRRHSRKDSSDSEAKDSDSASVGNSDSGDEGLVVPHIFLDATDYGEVIAEVDSSLSENYRYQVPAKSFVDLVARDLDATERTQTEGFAKFIVNSWSQGEDDLDGDITMEPESYEEESDDLSAVTLPKQENVETTPGADGTGPVKLTPEEVVDLLIKEFGPLSRSDEQERLIGEYDGGFCDDVAIVGTIHLTTHRLTFHASLLSIKSDLQLKGQVIKKGPVTVHKAALQRKRRVWLELTHDMITSYPSSKEEDRITPFKSILLSTVENILPEDPKHPKLLEVQFSNSLGLRRTIVEVDTEESAREWRRELKRAILLYRRNLDEVLNQTYEESDGVRINIPLTAIRKLSSRTVFKFSVLLSFDLHGHNDSSSSSVKNGEAKNFLSMFTKGNVRRLDLVVLNCDRALTSIKTIVEEAKSRALATDSQISDYPKPVIDFGSLSIMEEAHSNVEVKDEKEYAIRVALALQSEPYVWYSRALISRNIISRGYFVVSSHYICFWSKPWGTSFGFQYRLPLSLIKSASHSRRFVPRVFGMVLELDGQPDLRFDFTSEDARNESAKRVRAMLDTKNDLPDPAFPETSSLSSGTFSQTLVESPLSSPKSTLDSKVMDPTALLSPPSRTLDLAKNYYFPCENRSKVINMPSDAITHFPRKHIVCLTIGSRGDVQPYIALGLGLKKEGHLVTIVTHDEYKGWIEGWGLKHRTAGGDPGALMKLSVDHKMFSPQFFKESLIHFRSWLDDLLVDAWEQCKDAEILLESPSAMAGVHIAEALEIPYFRTFTMPWTKTSKFPHAFLSPPVESPSFNSSSYILFDNILWTATSGQINRWRKNVLGLSSTDMGHMAQSKIPFIYNFSTAVVPKPLDWTDSVIISGYWFLDNPDINWTPSESLLKWISKAKSDQKPIVYIGFGSITVPDPPAVSRNIIKAVLKSGVRAIISKGWSTRMSRDVLPEPEFPPECFAVDMIPHDWLFSQIDAALHHGGAGTTGASLRAGIPTLIKPWFGDQFFWASRVQKMGVGLKVSSLRSSELSKALLKATSDRIMKEKAATVGRKIRSEDGVSNAIHAIYTYYSRAKRTRSD